MNVCRKYVVISAVVFWLGSVLLHAGIMATNLAIFNFTNGAAPSGRLIQSADGDLYGTTEVGGDFDSGTVFRMTTTGEVTVLASFDGTNGAIPSGGLLQAADGDFYGTTSGGGTSGSGTVFKITTNGVLTSLLSFTGLDGAEPFAALIQCA